MWLAGASSPAPMLNACTRNETVKPPAPAGLTVAVPNLPSSFIIVTTSESPARRGGMRPRRLDAVGGLQKALAGICVHRVRGSAAGRRDKLLADSLLLEVRTPGGLSQRSRRRRHLFAPRG
jgi:hypothetical protein